jgi:Kef-type K+ transport system membrane component KefB
VPPKTTKMTNHLPDAAYSAMRWLSGGEDGEESFGVHIEYEDLYNAVIFLTAIYVSGQIATLVKMPSLVGEIVCGIILGPPLLDYVPNPEAFVKLGEIGYVPNENNVMFDKECPGPTLSDLFLIFTLPSSSLILLVIEAGIDIDVSTLKIIGTRGLLVAIVGSVLPIAFGIIISTCIFGTGDMKANIAAGASFGPTSLGIALNILRSGGIVNTPVGQMIVSAAVIDDMIALIVLSQLESLTGTITAAGILIPIVSALSYLIVGGYLALFVVPGLLEKHVLSHVPHEYHGKVELAIMFAILLGLMPATHYTKASYLMGAFVAGLSFCTSHSLHTIFVRQFKRLLQWLMRIFFAASIGFQVPIKDLFKGHVLWQGSLFTLALIGKLAVGFMVPNFTQAKSFTKWHLRDCLITGFSMAAEGEFAFVIAVFAVENGLIDKDLYASIILAVLLSTIVPPFLLRFTINYYNKKAEQELQDMANDEMDRNHKLEAGDEGMEGMLPTLSEREDKLVHEIEEHRAVFLCIQTQSDSAWGLIPRIMQKLAALKLDIIDYRSWHPRGINTTLVNEIYAKDVLLLTKKGGAQELLEERIAEVQAVLEKAIGQPETSKVKVQRWYPGVVEEIVESVHDKTKHKKSFSLEQRLVSEAAGEMDRRQSMQVAATHEKTVEEILSGMQTSPTVPAGGDTAPTVVAVGKPTRRRRQKMRSTPVVGGGLFGESNREEKEEVEEVNKKEGSVSTIKKWKPDFDFGMRGHRAEIVVNGESFDVRLNTDTLKALRTGFSGDFLDSRGMSIDNVSLSSGDVTNMLQGYVRSALPMTQITEEEDSETSSAQGNNGKSTDKDMPPV